MLRTAASITILLLRGLLAISAMDYFSVRRAIQLPDSLSSIHKSILLAMYPPDV